MEQTQHDHDEHKSRREKILNRSFYIILFILIAGSVAFTYFRIVIQKDYQIVAETSCDPQTETAGACFAREEEVATTTTDGTEATTTETSYYKTISKKAMNIYLCEATAEKAGCSEELTCTENESNCSYTYCDESNIPEGETCGENMANKE